MKRLTKYTSVAVVRLHTGLLELSGEQAAARQHLLKHIKGKIYEIVKGPVTFKAGETFGYSEDIPKAIASSLVDAKTGEPIAPQPLTAQSQSSAPAANEGDENGEADSGADESGSDADAPPRSLLDDLDSEDETHS